MQQSFVGIPYRQHGRDYDGADCWGLVYLYYRDALKTPIPAYLAEMQEREFHRRDIAPLITHERADNWEEASVPRHGDCALMRVGRLETHVGIWIEGSRILHTEGEGGSMIVRADDIRIKSRIVGFFRLKTC